MQVALDVLGILAIIGFGAFVIVLVADLLISIFDKHEGIFFNKRKKSKNSKKKDEAIVYTGENSGKNVKGTEKAVTDKEIKVDEKPAPVIDVLGIKEKPKTQDNVLITAVDMKKAEEEERLLKQKFAEVNAMEDLDAFDKFGYSNPAPVKKEDDFINKQIQVKEDNLDKVLPGILKQALNQGGAKTNEPKVDVFSVVEEPVMKELPDPEPAKVKIIYKQSKPEISELEGIRQDVFRMKKDAILTKHNKKRRVVESYEEPEVVVEEENKSEKSSTLELKRQKLAFATEKMKFIQEQASQTKKNKELEAEKKVLEAEIRALKSDLDSPKKPYYSKDYYERKLSKLDKDLKEAEKELRINKKDYIPLKKVKKAYERDSIKLEKQESIVAKQKISIYGSGASAKMTPEKKAKFDEDLKLLNELKESVYNCKQVLAKNKDKYPMLERTNKILEQAVSNNQAEIESIKEALNWYEQN